MAYRIAINGYGRIGRCVLRAHCESPDDGLRIVAVNDLADVDTLAHLTRYDSTHGRFPGQVAVDGGDLTIDGRRIRVSRAGMDGLPWAERKVDLVMECSGAFTDRATARRHIERGARRVLFSQPAESDVDATVVYGVNHGSLTARDVIVSNASCTTNCVAPVLKALHDAFGIEAGLVTTVHSAMNDQPVTDGFHHNDLRRTRSAMRSIIPVNTELARGIERILPELRGLLGAQAIRVPTVNVSAMDLSVRLRADVDAAGVNAAIRRAGEAMPPDVLGWTEEPLASCDFNHDPRSAVVDFGQTRVAAGRLVKLLVWFDNEWAFANRMLDVARRIRSLDGEGAPR